MFIFKVPKIKCRHPSPCPGPDASADRSRCSGFLSQPDFWQEEGATATEHGISCMWGLICWLYADFPPLFRVPGWLYLKSVGQIYLQSLQLQGPPISYNGCFLFCIVLGPTEPLTWKMAREIRRRSGDAPILKWGTPFSWLQGSFSIQNQQLFCCELGTRLTWPPNAIILEWCVTTTSILIFLRGVGWYEMLSDFQGLHRPKNWRSTPSRS